MKFLRTLVVIGISLMVSFFVFLYLFTISTKESIESFGIMGESFGIMREPFGIMGCSKIPFEKFLRDTKTQAEYELWKKNVWDKMTSEQKDTEINVWDRASCEQKKGLYTVLVDNKKKREAIDNMV